MKTGWVLNGPLITKIGSCPVLVLKLEPSRGRLRPIVAGMAAFEMMTRRECGSVTEKRLYSSLRSRSF